jgi:hypothetical protein
VIRGAAVLTVMLVLSAAAYEGTAAVWELIMGTRPGKGVPALLAAVIAAGYHPVRLRVEASMDEMLFGMGALAQPDARRLHRSRHPRLPPRLCTTSHTTPPRASAAATAPPRTTRGLTQ